MAGFSQAYQHLFTIDCILLSGTTMTFAFIALKPSRFGKTMTFALIALKPSRRLIAQITFQSVRILQVISDQYQ